MTKNDLSQVIDVFSTNDVEQSLITTYDIKTGNIIGYEVRHRKSFIYTPDEVGIYNMNEFNKQMDDLFYSLNNAITKFPQNIEGAESKGDLYQFKNNLGEFYITFIINKSQNMYLPVIAMRGSIMNDKILFNITITLADVYGSEFAKGDVEYPTQDAYVLMAKAFENKTYDMLENWY